MVSCQAFPSLTPSSRAPRAQNPLSLPFQTPATQAIHGAIDGFSRAVMFLKCSTNNEALTVLTLFEDAIQKFNVPARIRCDHGTENIQVAKWMLTRYGSSVKPVITGLSVHNQRIERLWRDVGDSFVSYYKRLFYLWKSSFYLTP